MLTFPVSASFNPRFVFPTLNMGNQPRPPVVTSHDDDTAYRGERRLTGGPAVPVPFRGTSTSERSCCRIWKYWGPCFWRVFGGTVRVPDL